MAWRLASREGCGSRRRRRSVRRGVVGALAGAGGVGSALPDDRRAPLPPLDDVESLTWRAPAPPRRRTRSPPRGRCHEARTTRSAKWTDRRGQKGREGGCVTGTRTGISAGLTAGQCVAVAARPAAVRFLVRGRSEARSARSPNGPAEGPARLTERYYVWWRRGACVSCVRAKVPARPRRRNAACGHAAALRRDR